MSVAPVPPLSPPRWLCCDSGWTPAAHTGTRCHRLAISKTRGSTSPQPGLSDGDTARVPANSVSSSQTPSWAASGSQNPEHGNLGAPSEPRPRSHAKTSEGPTGLNVWEQEPLNSKRVSM